MASWSLKNNRVDGWPPNWGIEGLDELTDKGEVECALDVAIEVVLRHGKHNLGRSGKHTHHRQAGPAEGTGQHSVLAAPGGLSQRQTRCKEQLQDDY
jgi:hypothetical protein